VFAHLFVHIPHVVEKSWKARGGRLLSGHSSTDVEERVESEERLQKSTFSRVDKARNPH
jgi:hypothetical protein